MGAVLEVVNRMRAVGKCKANGAALPRTKAFAAADHLGA